MGLLGFKNMQVTSVFADVGVFFFIGESPLPVATVSSIRPD